MFIIIFIAWSFHSFGQNRLQGYVYDANTREPLAYATIGSVNKNYGCYSDTTGYFSLFFSDYDDSIKISYLGYNSLKTNVRRLQENPNVLLTPKLIELEEAIISSSGKFKEFDIGFFTKRCRSVRVQSYPPHVHAIYIPYPEGVEQQPLIKSINMAYVLAYGRNSLIRVQLLTMKKNGMPDRIIYSKNIKLTAKKANRNSKATIEISDKQVYMPENGIFVALEWIFEPQFQSTYNGKAIPGPYIGLTETKRTNFYFIKLFNQTNWQKLHTKEMLSVGLTIKKFIN